MRKLPALGVRVGWGSGIELDFIQGREEGWKGELSGSRAKTQRGKPWGRKFLSVGFESLNFVGFCLRYSLFLGLGVVGGMCVYVCVRICVCVCE